MLRTLSLTVAWLFIILSPVWPYMASIGRETVNVRRAPNLQADVLFQVHFGYPVEVKQTKGSWVQIEDWDDNAGWVYRPLINPEIQTAIVMPEQVNIRKGPGLKYQVVEQAIAGQIYKIFSEKGNWVEIGYYRENSEVGWVRSDLVWGE